MKSRPCRRCGAPVLTVRERDVRVALTGIVDAAPLGVFAPLASESQTWEHHPRLGWMSLDIPRRRGNPLHASHHCKQAQDRTERQDR